MCKLHNELFFLPERMNIEKIDKLVADLHDEKEYVIHIRNLKQALSHGLGLKCIKKCIKSLNLIKLYERTVKKKCKKNFIKLISNAFFEKDMENLRKHGDVKLVTTEALKEEGIN